jgi:hypothetical protein
VETIATEFVTRVARDECSYPMPFEELRHVFVADELPTASLLRALADRRPRQVVKTYGLNTL